MPRRVKIRGERGRWLAEVEGEWLPVIHNSWRIGLSEYCDPMRGVKLDGKRYTEYVEALLSSDAVVMQRDADRETLARDGYVGVFSFKRLRIGEDGSVSLTLTGKLAEPRS